MRDRKAAKRLRREKRKGGRGPREDGNTKIDIVFTDEGLREMRGMAIKEDDAEWLARIDGILAYRAAHPNWQSEPASQ